MCAFLRVILFAGALLLIPGFTLAQSPVAAFGATPTSGCSPIIVQFTDSSTGNPTSWSWDLGNGTYSNLQNPSTSYFTAGYYTVRLIVSNANGSDTFIRTNYINVIPSPFVNFTSSDSSLGCVPRTVQFTNLGVPNSAGNPTYFWDFGDGHTDTVANPSHTYTQPGNFSVSLVITNSVGCTKIYTKPGYVQLMGDPVINFVSNSNIGCNVPHTVAFSNTTTGASSYLWLFGNGNTSTLANPTQTYAAFGTYNVTLIASNAGGCIDTLTQPAFVNITNLNAGFSQSTDSLCAGAPVSFTNTTVPAGASTWLFGDGNSSTSTNPTHIYGTGGTYTVTLIGNTNGCIDTATSVVHVLAKPVVAFSADTMQSCMAPLTVHFTNNTAAAVSYLWDFGDGTTSTAVNPTHVYTANGTYTVKLVATNSYGCKDSLTVPGLISIVPIQSTLTTNPYSGCVPSTVTFNPSLLSTQAVANYAWTFGDGGTGTGPSPSHTYTTAGTYTVTLTTTMGNGCVTTANTSVSVYTPPTVGFSASPNVACVSINIYFNNTTTNATGYLWNFGDGITSTDPNPVHPYGMPGNFGVTLIAYNGTCPDTFTIPNYITIHPPLADFIPSFECADRKHWTFTDISIGASTYLWNFGDGSPASTVANPVHTYAANGIYYPSLLVSNATTGCTDTVFKPIHIFDLTAQFTADDTTVCKGDPVSFTGFYYPSYASYSWDFGDGAVASGHPATISHVYNTAGIYTVRLIVRDSFNCADTMIRTNYIRVGGPTVAFTGVPLNGCAPLTVTFTGQSTPGGGIPLAGRTWRFGDGASLTTSANTATHTYTSWGSYGVTLIQTDANGCKDSLVKPDYVHVGTPNVGFHAPDTVACVGEPVAFVNTSAGYGTLSYLWHFGDGTTDTATNPSHVYTAPGWYTVKLVIIDGMVCRDSLVRLNYIHVTPIAASFTMSDSVSSCPPLTVFFTNTSTDAVSYQWTFGNGNISTQTHPTSVFNLPGVYTVTLQATNANGCVKTFTRTVTIQNGPSGTLTYTPITGCAPVSITFSATTQNTASLTFDMDNGFTHTTSSNVYTYTYTQAGHYLPKLILNNGHGCNTFLYGVDTINVNKSYAGFIPPAPVCLGQSVSFTDTSYSSTTGINSRRWNFGDGDTSIATNPTHLYTTAGTYNVRLIVGTAEGCLDTVTHTVIIKPLPAVDAGPTKDICVQDSAHLLATGAATYSWSPGTGLTCTNCPNPVATPPSTVTYTITGTGSNGCVNTDTLRVNVNPLPVMGVSPNTVICLGTPAKLVATGAATYNWQPPASLSCNTCDTVLANPPATTSYTVTGTTTKGCIDSAHVTVSVIPIPAVDAGPDRSICPGDATFLKATGAVSYLWYPPATLGCPTCQNTVATPTDNTTYTVVGTGPNGCTDTDQVAVTLYPQPDLYAGPDQEICEGDTAQLHASFTGSNGGAFTWSPAKGLTCTTCPDPKSGTRNDMTYYVKGTDINGCKDADTVNITVIPKRPTDVGKDADICIGDSYRLSATGGISYTWSPAATLSDYTAGDPLATPVTTTTYTVLIEQNRCFTDTRQVTVHVHPIPTVSAGPDQQIVAGTSTVIAAQGTDIDYYEWTPAEGLSCTNCYNPIATPTGRSTYTVNVSSKWGCKAKDEVDISLICEDTQLWLPNTFTPNGDGENDRFYVRGRGITVVNRIEVYNRWGELVYSATNVPPNDKSYGWDGTFRGQQLKPDVYVYLVSATCVMGEPLRAKGDISLVR